MSNKKTFADVKFGKPSGKDVFYLDQFNKDKSVTMEIMDRLEKKFHKSMIRTTPTELCSGKSTKKICFFSITGRGNKISVEAPVEGFQEKTYNNLEMAANCFFSGNIVQAISYIRSQATDDQHEYVRVGVDYFKLKKSKDQFGISRLEYRPWNKTEIVQDMGRDYIDQMPKYDGFRNEPDNKNYKRVHDNDLNQYQPFSHKPAGEIADKSKFPWIAMFIKHIFGEQEELGYKYIKVMYDHPKHILPILVLASTERQTGKSTFVDFMSILFGDNSVVLNPENISSQFNGSYASKTLLMIEESFFEKRSTLEKLKNLGTQKRITVNKKNITEYTVPFYGKLIITSNDEKKFTRIDEQEIRYWVRIVPSIKGEGNHSILSDFKEEIPYFLDYINEMEDIDLDKSRMVFTSKEIETDAVKVVKENSKEGLMKDVELIFEELISNASEETKEICFNSSDMYKGFRSLNKSNYTNHYLNSVLMKLVDSEQIVYKVGDYNAFLGVDMDDLGYVQRFKRKTGHYILQNPNYTAPTPAPF